MKRAALCIPIAFAILVGCSRERLNPMTERSSSVEPLGMFDRELDSDPRAQARAAMIRDARRRELRFREVLEPGVSYRVTRVPQREVDDGRWSTGDLFQLGAQLFHQRFRVEDGFGGADLPRFGRFQRGHRGGPDARQCVDCHRRGGPAGAGDASDNTYILGDGERPSTALERNPKSLVGLGYIELLAREMSAELAAQRSAMFNKAKSLGVEVREELTAKGVSFGALTARPDGTVDATEVAGVDVDLVVRPFGWKGRAATIREVVESELASHHGMQSEYFAVHAPAEEKGSMPAPDPDGDGVVSEVTEGQVTALTLYAALQEGPTVEPPTLLDEFGIPTDRYMHFWTDGVTRFREIGCASCHVPELELKSPVYSLPARETSASLEVDLTKEGAAPRLEREPTGAVLVRAFTDLKRHDLGPFLAEPFQENGRRVSEFLTPPLWGVARSRPYLHDGRAPTLEAAILMHGGEAQASRDAYAELEEHERASVRVYLTSLTRARRFEVP